MRLSRPHKISLDDFMNYDRVAVINTEITMPTIGRDRDGLKIWEGLAVGIALQAIKNSYVAHGWPEIAPLDEVDLRKGLIDLISDAGFPAWDALDPYREPEDGTRSDDLVDERDEPRGQILR